MKNTSLKNLQKLQNANKNLVNIPEGERKTFTLTVRRFYTNTNAEIIDKNLVPDNLKTKFPVFLFGNFDKDGNYWIGQKNLPTFNRIQYYFTDTYKGYFDQLSFSGFNDLQDKLTTGDVLQVYTDNIEAPNYFIWIVISGERRAYSSILSHPGNQRVFNMKYFSDNELQYNENLTFLKMDEIGNYNLDYINPLAFKTTQYGIDNFIQIPKRFSITNYLGLYFYMRFEVDLNTFIFNYNPINLK